MVLRSVEGWERSNRGKRGRIGTDLDDFGRILGGLSGGEAVGGSLREPVVVENARILVQNDDF